jgi:two-component system, LytTR family, sensor kinase
MHPLFNTVSRIFILLVCWAALTLSISVLISSTTAFELIDCLILFTPLYFLCLLFIPPNYYVCKGLPLGQSSWLILLSTHGLTVFVIVALWIFTGEAYATLLQNYLTGSDWLLLFDESRYINLSIVFIQFEMIVLIHYLFFAIEKTRDLEQAALKQKLLVSQAELQTLKATVHPHFLFNSLNTLANIALSAPEQAHRFCLLIADFLRYSVAYSKRSSAQFKDELEHVQNYLGIERERFGERLQISFDVSDDVMDVEVPPLILFPIIENAIKHGIDSCLEGGTLSVSARVNESMLVVEVSNPVDALGIKQKGTGHGLASIRQRLKTRYSEDSLLKTERKTDSFTVKLYLPMTIQRHLEEIVYEG